MTKKDFKLYGSLILYALLPSVYLLIRMQIVAVSGVNINTLLSIGGFWKTDDNGLGVMVGVTPLAVGSPALGRRERCLRTNVGWDFVNNKLIVAFSPMDVDIYIKGTYRDWI